MRTGRARYGCLHIGPLTCRENRKFPVGIGNGKLAIETICSLFLVICFRERKWAQKVKPAMMAVFLSGSNSY